MKILTTLSLATVLSFAHTTLAQDAVPATKIAPASPAAQERPAAPAPLSVGDKAPAFAVDSWVKGDPFESLESGKVHVMEFWATWCGPCIAAIPHLTELQAKYPDVRFVGVAASERGPDEAAKFAKVKDFVDGKGDGMGYRVAYVGDREKMSRPWMEAAGQSGIPCTFIVDGEGRVAWIGHPMSMDAPLEKIVAGSWDIDAAKAEFSTRREAEAARRAISMAMRAARQSGDYTEVLAALREQLAKRPSDDLRMTLVQVLAGPAKLPAEAWPIAEEILANANGNAMMLNALAWTIVDPNGGVAEPNLAIAHKAASRAVELTKENDGSILDTLARVEFRMGNTVRAIELQKSAIAKSADGRMKDEMVTVLAEYEAALKKG
ncbi:MAG: redoxin family protein [Phycisphaera sp.]|nr:redoxin family protein [Phycisphaera sp.]